MKTIYTLLLCLACLSASFAQKAYIPDPIFRAYIASLSPAAIIGDSMDTNDPVITTIDAINITGLGISSIEGIVHFDSLHIIEAAHNNITGIGTLPARMKSGTDGKANFSYNPIVQVGSLANYDMFFIDTLDVSHCQLSGWFGYTISTSWVNLDISHNNITQVMYGGHNAKVLNCSYNNITSIHFTQFSTPLISLNCSHNLLSGNIDFTEPDYQNLRYLDCSNNQLQTIELSYTSLEELNCSNNKITNIPALPQYLRVLNIDSNDLLVVNQLPNRLRELYCEGNDIVRFDSISRGLYKLYCRNNNLLCLPSLPDTLIELRAAQNYITCLPNLPALYPLNSDIGLAICSNTANCTNTVNVSGYVYHDLNNNSVYDAGDLPIPNHLVTMQPTNQVAVTDSAGHYTMPGYAGVAYTVRPSSVTGYYSVPDSIILTVPDPDSDTAGINFGFLQDTTPPFSDVKIYLTQVMHAVPGQVVAYDVKVVNVGTRTETGVVTVARPTQFTYNISVAGADVILPDTIKWNFTGLVPGAQLQYGVWFNVNGAMSISAPYQVSAKVSIVNNDTVPQNNWAVVNDTIAQQYPRNSKSVFPLNYNGNNLANGDYLDYTIRFQNTGNNSANHVWIIDTLDIRFDMSTLYIVSASHAYNVSISGNVLRVDFNGINLPDTSIDQTYSHGFFRFMIKPHANLSFSGTIKNKAYIYFDNGLNVVEGCGVGMCMAGGILNIYTYGHDIQVYSCSTNNPGSASVSATNANGSLQYLWSEGSTSSLMYTQMAGTYYVTVTDGCGTTAVGSQDIGMVPGSSIKTSGSSNNVTCPGGSDGSITILACGGFGPITYDWGGASTSNSRTGLVAGSYTCVMRDTAGQLEQLTFVIEEPQPIVTNEYNTPCQDSTYASVGSVWGGNSPNNTYTYLWSNGDTTMSITGVTAGDYTFTVTDEAGCTVSASISVKSVSAIGFSTLEVDGLHCGDPNSASIDYTTFGNGIVMYANQNYGTAASINGLGAGTYIISILPEANAGCSVDTIIEIGPLVYINAGAYELAGTPCGESLGSAAVNVNHVNTYNVFWSNGSTGVTISNLAAGTYTCTVTSTEACSATATVTINDEGSDISIAENVTDVSCYGFDNGTVAVNVTGGEAPYAYTWSNGASVSTIANLPANTYSLTVTDANGCTTNDEYDVGEPVQNAFLITTDSASACGVSDGAINVSATSFVNGPYMYLWNNNLTAANISNLSAGMYTVTITDAHGCSTTASATIDCVTGLERTSSISLNIYPNPAEDMVYIDLPAGDNYYITMRDMTGRTVKELSIYQYSQVYLSDLAKGMYTVEIRAAQQKISKVEKLVVR